MTAQITASLIAALRAEEIPAFAEYPQCIKQVPPDPCFVTAACAEAAGGEPVDSLFGDAVTASLTLRLRLHFRTDTVPAAYCAKIQQCILRVLSEEHYDFRGWQQGDLHYVSQLDRLVCEVKLRFGATVYLSGGDSE